MAGDPVQHEPDDETPRPLGRPLVAAAQVDVRPGDGVEDDVGGEYEVVAGCERAVLGTLAHELDERVEVVRPLSGPRALMERLIGGEQQRQMPVDELAQGIETALEPLAAGSVGRQHWVHRGPKVGSELAGERCDQDIARQPLPPKRRSGAAGCLRDPFQSQAVPATLAKNADRRVAELVIDDGHGHVAHRSRSLSATSSVASSVQ